MTLWELAPFQVRSSVFEIESYLMWLQKWKGGLWHQIWGWRQLPWAERQREGRQEAELCLRTRTHPYTPLLAGLHQLTEVGLRKNMLYQVKHSSTCMCCGLFCAQILVYRNIINESDANLPFWMPDPNIWGLKAPKISHPGSFLWHLAMRKQFVYPYLLFFPFHIAVQPNLSI